MALKRMTHAEIMAKLLKDRADKLDAITKPIAEDEDTPQYDMDIDYYTRQSNREIRAQNGKDYNTKE